MFSPQVEQERWDQREEEEYGRRPEETNELNSEIWQKGVCDIWEKWVSGWEMVFHLKSAAPTEGFAERSWRTAAIRKTHRAICGGGGGGSLACEQYMREHIWGM